MGADAAHRRRHQRDPTPRHRPVPRPVGSDGCCGQGTASAATFETMASNARPLSPDHIDYGVATPAPYGRTGPAVQMTSEPRASVRSIPSVDSLLRSVP